MKNKTKQLARGIGGILILVFFVSEVALASEITAERVIDLVNESRKEKEVAPLKENKTLKKVAQDKLDDMVSNNYFAHTSPAGITPWYWFSENDYDYKYAGENLAINFMEAEDQHKAWMDSPTHKKNIMNPNYQEIGIAVGAGEIKGTMAIITVQEFGTPAGGTVPAKDGKNFSSQEKSNLLKEGEKIAPAVLAVKETKNSFSEKEKLGKETGQNANYWERAQGYWAKNKFNIAYHMWNIAVLILILSSLLTPLILVLTSLDKVWALVFTGQQIYVDFKDNINKKIGIKVRIA